MAKPRFAVHPGVAMAHKVVANMKQKTGRSLEEWIALVRDKGPSAEKDRVLWLKSRHGLGTLYAQWIAAQSVSKTDAADPDAYLRSAAKYVDDLFSGPKAALRPIYEELMGIAMKLGKDVTATPCKTFVPLRRRYVFAQIKPTTRTRIDLGLALGQTKPVSPLIDTGGLAKGDRITHRIPIASASEIDATVKRWFKAAYDLDA
jgi:hypothetical protein